MPYALCTQVFSIYCGREACHLRTSEGQVCLGGLRNSCALTTILVSPRYLDASLLPPLSPLSLLSLSFLSLPYVTTPPTPPSWPSFSFAPPSPISIYHPLLCLHPLLSSFGASWSFSLPPVPLIQRLQCPFAGDLEVPQQRRRGQGVPSHPITQLKPGSDWRCQAKTTQRRACCLFLRGEIPGM